jgi:hypothetical protein
VRPAEERLRPASESPSFFLILPPDDLALLGGLDFVAAPVFAPDFTPDAGAEAFAPDLEPEETVEDGSLTERTDSRRIFGVDSRLPDLRSFWSMSCFPWRGWTEILLPTGRTGSDLLVRDILLRLLSESELTATREMLGALSWFLWTTVRAREL